MSLNEYRVAKRLESLAVPTRALIMAAILTAPKKERDLLSSLFMDIALEASAREKSKNGGKLESE